MLISAGSYENIKRSDLKIAFGIGEGWVQIFTQTLDPSQKAVVDEMARTMFGAYGVTESIKDAKIELSGSNGNYVLKVNDGKVIDLKTQPILGSDGKTAVTYINYPDPLFRTIIQGKVISGSYNDDEHHFTLTG